ncbi:MAG: hypothetical protein ACJ8CR_13705 [Roseiflexaceae bacterium]
MWRLGRWLGRCWCGLDRAAHLWHDRRSWLRRHFDLALRPPLLPSQRFLVP